MKIDRSRFLLLTGALSAATLGVVAGGAGCGTTTDAKGGAGTTDSGATDDAATSDGSADASADAATACLGDTAPEVATDGGDAGDCAATSCATACTSYATNFKPGIAAAASACLLTLPTCESADLTPCLDPALAKACTDATATTLCAQLVTGCNGDAGSDAGATDAGDAGTTAATFNQASCEALVNGLSATGRTAFTSCITEGTPGNCTADPTFCLGLLKY
jgi:hypothetical protein